MHGCKLDVEGSSPHVRGAFVDEVVRRGVAGIIPACAGSISARCRTCSGAWDHPRMCGEHARRRRVDW